MQNLTIIFRKVHMSIIYLSGIITVNLYRKTCQENQLPPERVVFLFPGNSGHHGADETLFSIKKGAGLAQASAAIGNAGYPTLSLPTTGMEQWSNNALQQRIVKAAIADLYRAIGAGYSLALPVRAHRNKVYFNAGLKHNSDYEPSFWGGVQTADNLNLANHYTKALDQLADFIVLPEAGRLELLSEDNNKDFLEAYNNGKGMREGDPWLQNPLHTGRPIKQRAPVQPTAAAAPPAAADPNPLHTARPIKPRAPVQPTAAAAPPAAAGPQSDPFSIARNRLNTVVFIDDESLPAKTFEALKKKFDDLSPAQKREQVVVTAMDSLFMYARTLAQTADENSSIPEIDMALKTARQAAHSKFASDIKDLPGHPNKLIQGIGISLMVLGAAVIIALAAYPLLALVSLSAVAVPVLATAVSAVTLCAVGAIGIFASRSKGAHHQAQTLASVCSDLNNQTIAVTNPF